MLQNLHIEHLENCNNKASVMFNGEYTDKNLKYILKKGNYIYADI